MIVKRFFSTMALFLAAACALLPQRSSFDETGSEGITAALEAEAARGFSGAVLVVRGDRILVDAAYGAERGAPMRRNSRFWIASAGKQFTSAAVLKLRDRGLLTLDDPLEKFFPDAPDDKRTITVRQLLSHTSGFDQSYASEELTNRAQAVRRMLAEPLIDTPGAAFHYSNTNYQLAVAIVEVVGGLEYRVFVESELFKPAGLTDTGQASAETTPTVAPAQGDTPARLTKRHWGGQGDYSTTHDLFAWYRALRSGRVIERDSIEALFSPVVAIGEGHAALGWFLGKTGSGAARIFTRGNEDFGANALIYAYPETATVVVVLSHAGDSPDDASWSRAVHAKIEKILFP